MNSVSHTCIQCAQHRQRHQHLHHSHVNTKEEKKLKNTFGWARIDVLVMLSCFVFLASLCFSLVVEAVQTLVHIEHQDEMHHPISVMCVGASGLLLNGLCYLLIGGKYALAIKQFLGTIYIFRQRQASTYWQEITQL
jgi:hypothetical protein